MADDYSYEVALHTGDAWRITDTGDLAQIPDRDPKETARGLLQDWLLDNPNSLIGGQRLEVFGDNPGSYPPESRSGARVWVFRGRRVAHEELPTAAAYLVTELEDLGEPDLDIRI
ncbi:hypothetical protein ACWDWO_15385 [Actinopolymorpha singaporensis]|uniref:Uncharacterized protein n=1 Tax=Actinopolymorpha singaporensis TaxID=117157 RepID=A0A1H1SS42_9ACTN|nr:hypothetical protein [Actinopolymorpha singaporensis]SDS50820.1 hypothetical protein SAMN04489717_2916 [Actinopolymorpha singaporensis]